MYLEHYGYKVQPSAFADHTCTEDAEFHLAKIPEGIGATELAALGCRHVISTT